MPRCGSSTFWSTARCLALACVPILLSACERNTRKPVFPVKGQILFEGKPASGATVFFVPTEVESEAISPYGVTDANGTFTLTTYLTYDGAPAGDYVVTVRWPGPPKKGGEDESGPDKLQGRYGDPKTSKLKTTVEKKPNELTFQLTKK